MVWSYALEKAQPRKGMRLVNTRTLVPLTKNEPSSRKAMQKNSGIYAIIKRILIRVAGWIWPRRRLQKVSELVPLPMLV